MHRKFLLVSLVVLFAYGQVFAESGNLNIGNDTTICSGNCLTLHANITGKYLWSTGDTTASIKVCPTNSTEISLKVTSGSNVYTDSINITVDKNGVWPGDANNDGTVSGRDVLNIGLAFGSQGAARANTTNDWDAQHADNWNKSFNNGVNYKYADCNGDGKIDSNDLVAVHDNWSESHSKTQDTIWVPGNPQLYLIASTDSFYPGEHVDFGIYLGTAIDPVENVYGVNFVYQFTPGSVQPGSMQLTVNQSNCWLYGSNGPGAVVSFMEPNYVNDNVNVALTRTVQPGMSGSGKIGVLSIAISDNVAGKTSGPTPLTFGFTEVDAVNGNGANVALTAINKTFYIVNKALGINTPTKEGNDINMYPNPLKGNLLNIDMKGMKAGQISIVDMVGKTVYTLGEPTAGLNQLPLPYLNAGMYLVRISTQQGMIMRKLNINR